MHVYDTNDIKRIFGLSPPTLRALIRSGSLRPARLGSKLRFSYPDLLLLRTVTALRSAGIPSRKIHRALRLLRQSLPADAPMAPLSLSAVGERIAVRDGVSIREAESGQYALELEPAPQRANVHRMSRPAAGVQSAGDAHRQFVRACELEDTDIVAAGAAYEASLAADPTHLESRINLGRLLHLAGRLPEAERIYRAAAEPSALLSFNLAVLLEDLNRDPDAIAAYREAIAHDPGMADAHFNLARLHERAGEEKSAFKHLLAYRRLLNEANS